MYSSCEFCLSSVKYSRYYLKFHRHLHCFSVFVSFNNIYDWHFENYNKQTFEERWTCKTLKVELPPVKCHTWFPERSAKVFYSCRNCLSASRHKHPMPYFISCILRSNRDKLAKLRIPYRDNRNDKTKIKFNIVYVFPQLLYRNNHMKNSQTSE